MPAQTRWGATIALIVAGVVSALQIGKAAIALPVLQGDLSLSLLVAAWVVGTYGVLGAVAGLPAGILASLAGARITLVGGLAIAGIGSLVGAWAESGVVLIGTRVLEGCGSLAASLTIPRLLGAAVAPRHLQPVLAVWGAHLPLGSLIVLLAGPPMLAFGWQTLWLVNGVVALGYAAALTVMRIDEMPTAPAGAARSLAGDLVAVLTTPGPALLAFAFGLYTSQYLALSGLLPSLLVERDGLSIATAGTVSAIVVGANALGNMSAGALLRLGVPAWTILIGAFAFVGPATIAVFSERAPVALVVLLAAVNLGLTGLIPASIYAAAPQLAPTSARLAIVLGLINQVTNIGNLAGPAALAATVAALGWSGAPLVFAAIAVAGIVIALLLRRALPRPAQRPDPPA